MKKINYSLEQLDVINLKEGYHAVSATAGSGKTQVIVERYKALRNQGVSVNDLLSITFTREAAKNMRKRANEIEEGTRPCGFLTFHSLAFSFVKLERDNFPFQLAQIPLISDRMRSKFLYQSTVKYGVDFKTFANWVSQQKHHGILPQQALKKATNALEYNNARCYIEFEALCKNAGVLDFDDLIIEMVNILSSRPDVLERWSYKWVQVDEAQDADEIQWRLVQLLSKKYGNVFAVGDSNQEIYSWRTVSSGLFEKFHEQFEGAKYHWLSENFRSTPQIVEFCKKKAPIANMLKERMKSNLPKGPEPSIVQFMNSTDEAVEICKHIQGKKSAAILTRTNRQLRIYEDILTSMNVKFRVLSKAGFYNQEEIQNILAFLTIQQSPFDYAVVRAIRSPFYCTRFIRKEELILILKEIQKNDPTTPSFYKILSSYNAPDNQQARAINDFFKTLQTIRNLNGNVSNVLRQISETVGAFDYYDDGDEQEHSNVPLENINELINISKSFKTIADFLEHIRSVQDASRSRSGIALGTIHSAKGLEFDTVYLVNTTPDYMPHPKGDPNEEARLFYVGLSRPAKQLIISYAGFPSVFIVNEVPALFHSLKEQISGKLDFVV